MRRGCVAVHIHCVTVRLHAFSRRLVWISRMMLPAFSADPAWLQRRAGARSRFARDAAGFKTALVRHDERESAQKSPAGTPS
jgi:hypothetical protein